jgi:D-alanyl-D-alanine carboxypeptidase
MPPEQDFFAGVEQKQNPKPRHRQVYAFVACVVLFLMSVGVVQIHSYIVSQEVTYSSSVSNSNAPFSRSSPVPLVKNEILPIATAVVNSQRPAVSPSQPPLPVISPVTAWAYLVGNVATGQVYLAKNVSEVLPIASISKLTATLVARQFMNQNQLVPITQQVLDVYSDSYGLELGEQFPVSEIYYPILLQSNDNAVEALAFTYGNTAGTVIATSTASSTTASSTDVASSTDTAFVEKMNEYASELGMTRSHFIDASGLSDGNVSTAADMFTLAKFLYTDKLDDKIFTPNIFAITTMPSVFIATTSDHGSHDFLNINPFAGDPDFLGGKTGRTYAAGETMLSIFNYQAPAGNVVGGQTKSDPIVVIVLHSDFGTREADTEKLLTEVEDGIAAGKY